MYKVHKLNIQTTMNVFEDNLDYLINFEDWNGRLKEAILKEGDKQNRETNVQADMTSWKMHSDNKSFQALLRIIVNEKLDKFDELGLVQDGKVAVYCQDMWGAVYKKGDYTKEHSHKGALYAFTYYVQVPEGSSPLVFTNPGLMQIQPRTGTLLIWHADYKHMVPEQQVDGERIMIAGNLNVIAPEQFTQVIDETKH
jgi:hypothetical protein